VSERLNLFRDALQATIDAQKNRDDQYSRAMRALSLALLSDFDSLFPHPLVDMDRISLVKLAKEHCHPFPGCPICGQKMRLKPHTSVTRIWWGCTMFPSCKGSRNWERKPTINDGMRLYLLEKQCEGEYDENDRFSKIVDG